MYAVARYQMCLVLLWLEEGSARKEVPRGSKEAQMRPAKSAWRHLLPASSGRVSP